MSTKVKLTVHLLSQILAQAAIAAIVPAQYDKYYAALVAVVGVVAAFYDTAQTNQ